MIKQLVLLIVFLFSFQHFTYSQLRQVWVKTYGNTWQREYGKEIVADSNGNSYTVGYFVTDLKFGPLLAKRGVQRNFFLLKSDSLGEPLWVIFGEGRGMDVKLDGKGNVYAVGAWQFVEGELDGVPLNSKQGIYLIKVNSNGERQWLKTFNTAPSLSTGYKVDFDSIGNVYLAGSFSNSIEVDLLKAYLPFNKTGIFLSKFDTTGKLLNMNTLHGDSSILLRSFKIGPASNLFLTGSYIGNVDFDNNKSLSSTAYRSFVIKTKELANPEWIYSSYNEKYTPHDILIDKEGNIITAGTDGYHGVIEILEKDGSFSWQKAILSKTVSSRRCVIYSIELNSLDEILAAGYCWGDALVDGKTYYEGNNRTSLMLLKLKKNRTVPWLMLAGGPYFDEGLGVAVNHNNNNVFFTGKSDDLSDSKIIISCLEDDSLPRQATPVKKFNQLTSKYSLSILPNGETVILKNKDVVGRTQIEIFNSLGQKVAKKSWDEDPFHISSFNLSPGNYVSLLRSEDHMVHKFKVIIY